MLDIGQMVPAGILGLVLVLTEFVKGWDKDGRFTRFYPVIPLILGILAAFLYTNPWNWKMFATNAILYVGGSSYLYKFGKTTLLGK